MGQGWSAGHQGGITMAEKEYTTDDIREYIMEAMVASW